MRHRATRSKGGHNGGDRAGGPNGNAPPTGRSGGNGADAKRTFERYVEMAKAAASAGDAIESEKYYQYADHFLRLMKAGAH